MIAITPELLSRLINAPADLSVAERLALAQAAENRTHPGSALLLTQKEVAAMLRVERTTIWRMTRDGILRPTEIFPGTFRYHRTEVEAFGNHGWQHVLAARRSAA